MQKICIYHVEVKGELDMDDFNASSPIQIRLVQQEHTSTQFSAQTDQPGLIGLIRHLHRHGFVLMAVRRIE